MTFWKRQNYKDKGAVVTRLRYEGRVTTFWAVRGNFGSFEIILYSVYVNLTRICAYVKSQNCAPKKWIYCVNKFIYIFTYAKFIYMVTYIKFIYMFIYKMYMLI